MLYREVTCTPCLYYMYLSEQAWRHYTKCYRFQWITSKPVWLAKFWLLLNFDIHHIISISLDVSKVAGLIIGPAEHLLYTHSYLWKMLRKGQKWVKKLLSFEGFHVIFCLLHVLLLLASYKIIFYLFICFEMTSYISW